MRTDEVTVKASTAKPPPRYSGSHPLLSAMEGAGKMVDDEELKAAMAGRGLGTQPPRAQIIENLIGERYMHREGRELIPTARPSPDDLLNGLSVTELTQPELTPAIGNGSSAASRRNSPATNSCGNRRNDPSSSSGPRPTIATPFPAISASSRRLAPAAAASFAKPQEIPVQRLRLQPVEDRRRAPVRAGRNRNPAHRPTDRPSPAFRNKMGRAFAAAIGSTTKNGTGIRLWPGPRQREGRSRAVDFSGQEALGRCPKRRSGVFDHGAAYVCEKSVGPPRLRLPLRQVILQQPVEAGQMQKLLATGKTDLLKEFVSNRTRRKFSACLVVQAGKVGFNSRRRLQQKAGGKEKDRSLRSQKNPRPPGSLVRDSSVLQNGPALEAGGDQTVIAQTCLRRRGSGKTGKAKAEQGLGWRVRELPPRQ